MAVPAACAATRVC